MGVVLVSRAVTGRRESRTHGHLRYDAVGSVMNQVQGACREGRRNGELSPGYWRSLSRVEMAKLVLKVEQMSPDPGRARTACRTGWAYAGPVCAAVEAAAAWAGLGGDGWMASGGQPGPTGPSQPVRGCTSS